MVTKELTERFLQNKCSESEREEVLQYFEQNPDEAEALLSTDEWDHFSITEKLDPGVSQKLWEVVQKKTFRKEKTTFINLKTITAAASVLLLIGFMWAWPKSGGENESGVAVVEKIDTRGTEIKTEVNNTSSSKTIYLPDGSQVELDAGTRVSYPASFSKADKREINLSGRALFRVTKDSLHPFIVNAGNISTTVLGTTFSVKADFLTPELVRLFEGKVMVKFKNRPNEKVILKPGEECENIQERYFVKRFENRGSDGILPAKSAAVKSFSQEGEWFIFNNHPLADVFSELAKAYHADIVFDRNDLKEKYFIGKLRKTGNPEQVIRSVCELNNLGLQTKNNRYFIRTR